MGGGLMKHMHSLRGASKPLEAGLGAAAAAWGMHANKPPGVTCLQLRSATGKERIAR